MSEPTESKAVERSCTLYLRLLRFYPKAYREEYGAPMLQLFRDQCRDAWTARRTRGLIFFWLRVLPDLLKTSVLEHLSNFNWRISMLFRSQIRPVAVFLSVFAAVFLLTVLTSALIAFSMPNSFHSTAQITVDEKVPANQAGPFPFYPDSYFPQSEFAVIRSHVVLSNAVEALNLRDLWGKKFNRGTTLSSSAAETTLRRAIDLHAIQNTKIIEVSAFSDNPDEAARLANGVVEAYQAFADSSGDVNGIAWSRMVYRIASAVPEPHHVRPNRPLIITLGLMLGSVLGSIAGAISVGVVTLFGRSRNPTASRSASALVP